VRERTVPVCKCGDDPSSSLVLLLAESPERREAVIVHGLFRVFRGLWDRVASGWLGVQVVSFLVGSGRRP